MILNQTFSLTSEWQHLSPYWSFHFNDETKVASWCLKAFGHDSLCLRLRESCFEIHSPKHWAFVQSEFAGHQKMHVWCKGFGVDINDASLKGFQIPVWKGDVDYIDHLVFSITADIDLTLLFFEINEKIKQLNHA